jgi:hypothetical protein
VENHEFPHSLAIIIVAVIIGTFFVVGVILGLILYAGFFAPAAP